MQPTHTSKAPGYNPWKLYKVMSWFLKPLLSSPTCAATSRGSRCSRACCRRPGGGAAAAAAEAEAGAAAEAEEEEEGVLSRQVRPVGPPVPPWWGCTS
jgi:hypothetical protein